MRRRTTGALGAIALLIAACTGAGIGGPTPPPDRPSSSAQVPPSPETVPPAGGGPDSAARAARRLCEVPEPDLEGGSDVPAEGPTPPVIAEVMRQLERIRGFDYTHPVVAQPVTQEEIGADIVAFADITYPEEQYARRSLAVGHDRRDPGRHQPARGLRELRRVPGDRLLQHAHRRAEVRRHRVAFAARPDHARPRAHPRDRRPALRARAARRPRRRVPRRGARGRPRARRGQRDVLHAAVGPDVPHGDRTGAGRDRGRGRKTSRPRASRRSSSDCSPGRTTRGCDSSPLSRHRAVWTRSTLRSPPLPSRRSR